METQVLEAGMAKRVEIQQVNEIYIYDSICSSVDMLPHHLRCFDLLSLLLLVFGGQRCDDVDIDTCLEAHRLYIAADMALKSNQILNCSKEIKVPRRETSQGDYS